MLIAEEEVLISTIQFTKVLISTWESILSYNVEHDFLVEELPF